MFDLVLWSFSITTAPLALALACRLAKGLAGAAAGRTAWRPDDSGTALRPLSAYSTWPGEF